MEIRRKRADSTPGPREWFTGQAWMDEIAAPVPPSRTRVLPGQEPEDADAAAAELRSFSEPDRFSA